MSYFSVLATLARQEPERCPRYVSKAVDAPVSAGIPQSSALVFILAWLVSYSLEEGSKWL